MKEKLEKEQKDNYIEDPMPDMPDMEDDEKVPAVAGGDIH